MLGAARAGRGEVPMRRAVDWREVERELEELPEDFKDQGAFDSLPHVVEILRTLDPSQALGELRDRQQRVEALVDDIVKGYHGGFNKSIHNYSEILRLFTEAQTQGKSIRTSLLALKKQLGTRTTQLRGHWQRSNALRHTLNILDDIEKVAHVPNKVDALFGIAEPPRGGGAQGRDDEPAGGSGKGAHQASNGVGSGDSAESQKELPVVSGSHAMEVYEKSVGMLSFALAKLRENEDLQQVRALCEMRETILAKKRAVGERILGEIQAGLYRRRDQAGQADASQESTTRARSLSVQTKEEQGADYLSRLAACLLTLEDGKDAFTTVVLKELQQRLQRWIRAFLADLEPYKPEPQVPGSPRGPTSHGLCDGKLVKYVNKHFRNMCKDLAKVFDQHWELSAAAAEGGRAGDEGSCEGFATEVWSQMQEELIALLCAMMNLELPARAFGQRSPLAEGLQRVRGRSIAHSSGGNTLAFTFSTQTMKRKTKASGAEGKSQNGLVSSTKSEASSGYSQAVGACIEDRLRGIYLLVGLYGPIQGLIKHMTGRIGEVVGSKENEGQQNSSRILSFLEDHILEDFVPTVKNDCTNNLKVSPSALDQQGDGATSYRRAKSRETGRASATFASNGDEAKPFISAVQQLVEFVRVFPSYASHFSAITEAMLVNFLSLSGKWTETLEGELSSKLAFNPSICSIMSREQQAKNLLSAEYFLLTGLKGSKEAEQQNGSEGESSLTGELQKLRPISSENLFSSTAKLATMSNMASNMHYLVSAIEEFVASIGKNAVSAYPLEGLLDLVTRLKIKIGLILRTLRLEMKIKLLTGTQHLESFTAVENLGCESVSNASGLIDDCPRYVLILASTLGHCSETMTPDDQRPFDYVFGDTGSVFPELKVSEKDQKLLQGEMKNTRLSRWFA